MPVIGNSNCTQRAALNAAVDDTRQVVQGNSATLIAWLVLNIWSSHLGLPFLIITISIAKNIRRHATFINLCVTWIIVGLSSSLLTSVSAFALVFQVFHVMRAAFQERDPESHETLRKWTLLVSPYVAFVVFATWTAFVGLNNPELVTRRRRFFYCSVKDSGLTDSITAFSLGVLLVTSPVWILYIILSHWRTIRSSGLGRSVGTDLSLICRTAAFTLWIILGMSLSALSMKAPRSAVPDMALATMGSAVLLVFGTQRDILRTWMFWKRNRQDDRGARQPTASPLNRTDSPSSSEHSIKQACSSTDSGKDDGTHEIEHQQNQNGRFSSRTFTFLNRFFTDSYSAWRYERQRACDYFQGEEFQAGKSDVLSSHLTQRNLATAAPSASSSEAPSPPPSKSSGPEISKIVDDISGLTLLQAADLVSLLKSRLNIQEIAMPTAAAPAAPAAATEEAPAEEKPKEKTVFNVKLESFDASAKPKVIREVKAMNPTLTLVAAKSFVESLPKVLKENLPKEEAEKLKKTFEALGGVVSLD
ncbi:hypothetical protein A7U60_g5380 [Sanghuangporus baumii]|uniref:Ribosomal protein L7/L12 n=1 Tax=Sanghuangporus baumii TaxID=108892 RepID=A0A9Q5HWT9_SANBA|nr:hypothetical protein A7U60_g5380 [Sanghuangporus baumii]